MIYEISVRKCCFNENRAPNMHNAKFWRVPTKKSNESY